MSQEEDVFHDADDVEEFAEVTSNDLENAQGADQEGSAEEVPLSPEERQERLAKAQAIKEDGNALYNQADYGLAIERYTHAIETCPNDEAEVLAKLYSNRSACFASLNRYEEVVADCDEALRRDPSYVKAYYRRAVAHEKLDSLPAALDDYKKVVELDSEVVSAADAVKRLEPIVKEIHEKQKEEMIGKLKDLGNSLLGHFGLSVDNFQFKQDPKTGGYSVNFQQ